MARIKETQEQLNTRRTEFYNKLDQGRKDALAAVGGPEYLISLEDSDIPFLMDAWEKVVDVQMHFNDLELRIRSYAMTFLGVVIAAVGVLFKSDSTTSIRAIAFILLIALVVWAAFYLMDRWHYHRLLQGSVNQGQNLETLFSFNGLPIRLTSTIKDTSPIGKIHSDRKIDIFYLVVAVLIAALILALLEGWLSIASGGTNGSGGHSSGSQLATSTPMSATTSTPSSTPALTPTPTHVPLPPPRS